MIITEDKILLNLNLNNVEYKNLTLTEIENLLKSYKINLKENLEPKEIVDIPNVYIYFCTDVDKNQFSCKIYKTSLGLDRWILFMKDNNEGYALYMNPSTNKMELAWYNKLLNEPLNEENEKKMITCYVPNIF